MFCAIEGLPELKGGWGVLAFVILFIVVAAISVLVKAVAKKKTSDAEVAEENDDAAKEADLNEPAPGRSGELVLHNVTDREAAMVMAITAEKLQKPINTLQFVSITKITEEK